MGSSKCLIRRCEMLPGQQNASAREMPRWGNRMLALIASRHPGQRLTSRRLLLCLKRPGRTACAQLRAKSATEAVMMMLPTILNKPQWLPALYGHLPVRAVMRTLLTSTASAMGSIARNPLLHWKATSDSKDVPAPVLTLAGFET
jgi:hypothetical protein